MSHERYPEITSQQDGVGWARLPGTDVEVQTFVRSGIPWVRWRPVPGTVGVRPYDGAVLVVTPDTPPGGVTMMSNAGTVHLTAADLEPDERPTDEQVRDARKRFAAGAASYSDYMTLSRADVDEVP